MIKLNRTTEYGLIALRHMSRKQSAGQADVTSAREIADHYGFPFEITAKTLQRLKDTALIHSAQGARGGYTLRRPLNELTLGEFLRLMEGPYSVVACAADEPPAVACGCEYNAKCEIQHVMRSLNDRIMKFLEGISLSEFAAEYPDRRLVSAGLSGITGTGGAPVPMSAMGTGMGSHFGGEEP